jgi:hypothetical protein
MDALDCSFKLCLQLGTERLDPIVKLDCFQSSTCFLLQ